MAASSQTSPGPVQTTIPPSVVLPAVLTTISLIFLGCVTFTIILLFFLQRRSKRKQNTLLIEMREIVYRSKEERQDREFNIIHNNVLLAIMLILCYAEEIINELARELPPKIFIPTSDIRILDIPLGRGNLTKPIIE